MLLVGGSAGVRAQLGGVSAGSGAARATGLKRVGNAFTVPTPDGAAVAPLAFSFYRPGIPEPVDDNVMWWYCEQQGTTLQCVHKARWFGIVLVFSEQQVTLP